LTGQWIRGHLLLAPEVVGLVASMYTMLDGILVWRIQVKTLGFGLWPEPLITTPRVFVKA
jgi:uncharacterized membrane protein YkgB